MAWPLVDGLREFPRMRTVPPKLGSIPTHSTIYESAKAKWLKERT